MATPEGMVLGGMVRYPKLWGWDNFFIILIAVILISESEPEVEDVLVFVWNGQSMDVYVPFIGMARDLPRQEEKWR